MNADCWWGTALILFVLAGGNITGCVVEARYDRKLDEIKAELQKLTGSPPKAEVER